MKRIIALSLCLLLACSAHADVTSVPATQLTATIPVSVGGTGVTAGAGQWQTQPITVDFSVAGDNAIVVPFPAGFTRMGAIQVYINAASADISAANFGLFTTTGGGGTAIIAAATAITVTATTDNTVNNSQLTNSANFTTESYLPAAANTIYFRVGTTAAAGRTAKVMVRFNPLP